MFVFFVFAVGVQDEARAHHQRPTWLCRVEAVRLLGMWPQIVVSDRNTNSSYKNPLSPDLESQPLSSWGWIWSHYCLVIILIEPQSQWRKKFYTKH